jgi:hypothetical protein
MKEGEKANMVTVRREVTKDDEVFKFVKGESASRARVCNVPKFVQFIQFIQFLSL